MRKVKKIFGDNKPSPSVQAILTIYEALAKMAEGRIRYAKEIGNFSIAMDSLFAIWAPSYANGIKEFTSVYNSISELNTTLAANELRVAEDVRDCYERYLAVDSFAKEYNSISEKYENDSNNLINALGSELYEKRVGNYEQR